MSTQAPDRLDRSIDVPPVPRRAGRRSASVALALLLVLAGYSTVRNPALQWDVVAEYFTAPIVLSGLLVTLELTAIALFCGFALGTALALLRLYGNPTMVALSWGYTWLFRSVPILVQLLFWYNISLLYPRIALQVPLGPTLFDVPTQGMINGFAAAAIGLTLHEAAHAAEIVRGGLLSVDTAQTEAAQALGLSRWRTLHRIVLPQAMRSIVPPAANQATSLVKGTSVVSVIAGQDLLFATQLVYNRNYLVIPLLLVATLWYLVATSILSIVQYLLERYFARGTTRTGAPPAGRIRLRWRSRTSPGRDIDDR